MTGARLSDGQRLLAVNDLFLGSRRHTTQTPPGVTSWWPGNGAGGRRGMAGLTTVAVVIRELTAEQRLAVQLI
jgi:hypothetical protein